MSKPKGFQPGIVANPAGRPLGATGKPSSTLRKTLKKLKAIEDKAIENIEKSINGSSDTSNEVDKEQLATSKWLVTTIVTVQKACLAEEEFKTRDSGDDEDNAPSVTKEKPKFSLKIAGE